MNNSNLGFHVIALFAEIRKKDLQCTDLCLNKQATVDDDPTGIRWINNDLIGLK